MHHTKLFRKFPCKFGINKNDDGSYSLFYNGDDNILGFMLSDPLYRISDVENVEDVCIVPFRYNDGADDYSETVQFDSDDLKKHFPSISDVVFVRKRLPNTTNQVACCAHYSVYVENEDDCKSIEDYVFDRFGYLKIGETKINNQTVLMFANHAEYCY